MEKGVRAFFYEYKYYLLPDDCAETAELPEGEFPAKRLKEERCLAPDFIYESIAEEVLKIEDRAKVFPVSANLYSQAEYDALLRVQVEKHCPGCLRYSEGDGDGDGLSGHHREISLSGVCYEREEMGGRPSFADCMLYFWDFVGENLNRIAAWADEGNQTEINKLLNGVLSRFFLPLDFFCGEEDGHYCLCMSAHEYPEPDLRPIVSALAASARLSCLREAGWSVYPYFVKGVYKPRLRPDYFRRPPRLFVSAENGEEFPSVAVLEKGAAEWSPRCAKGRRSAMYKYLSAVLGENLLLAGSDTIGFSDKVREDLREVTADDLAEILTARAEGAFGSVPYPPPFLLSADSDKQADNPLPYKEKVRDWVTTCCSMCPEYAEMPFEVFGIGYAYLYFPDSGAEGDSEKRRVWEDYWKTLSAYPAPVFLNTEAKVFSRGVGMCLAEDGFALDYMVFDERAFFRALRALAPVLTAYSAKIVTVKQDGVIVYDPGYVIRPEDAGVLA